MFERYTEPARRALFFARYEVSERGGERIEPDHLLLGLLQAEPQAVLRFSKSGETEESMRQRFIARAPGGAKRPESDEIPFSRPMVQALERARIEADQLGDATIRPEHLLLGVLVEPSGVCGTALEEAGVTIHAVREYLRSAR